MAQDIQKILEKYTKLLREKENINPEDADKIISELESLEILLLNLQNANLAQSINMLFDINTPKDKNK